MKIDLTCPVELWQYAMPTEDDADCTFIMNNPVSYTHLTIVTDFTNDVFVGEWIQEPVRGWLEGIGTAGWLVGCLLYTSRCV